MNLYNYDKHTFEYLSTTQARRDPLGVGYLIPANATLLEAPPLKKEEAAIFEDKAWTIKNDFRKSEVWLRSTAEKVTVTVIGELSEELTLLSPDTLQFPLFVVDKWEEDKDKAYEFIIGKIESKKREENEKPFPYKSQTYKSDPSAKNDIEGVYGQCLHMDSASSIPTFKKTAAKTGKWLTMEYIYVSYTVAEFIIFATAYFERFSWNFDNRVEHREGVYELHDDPDSTAEDILNYDFSDGWE